MPFSVSNTHTYPPPDTHSCIYLPQLSPHVRFPQRRQSGTSAHALACLCTHIRKATTILLRHFSTHIREHMVHFIPLHCITSQIALNWLQLEEHTTSLNCLITSLIILLWLRVGTAGSISGLKVGYHLRGPRAMTGSPKSSELIGLSSCATWSYVSLYTRTQTVRREEWEPIAADIPVFKIWF